MTESVAAPVVNEPAPKVAEPAPVATDVPPVDTPVEATPAVEQPAPVATDAAVINLTVPENANIGEESVAAIQQFAETHGLSHDQAQAMLDTSAKSADEWKAGEVGRRNTLVAEWEHQAMADPEIGGAKFNETKRLAADFVSRFGNDEIRKILSDTGYGSNREVLRMFSKAAAIVQEERKLVSPSAPPVDPSQLPRADRMGYTQT